MLPKSVVYDAWKAGPSIDTLEEMVKLIQAGRWRCPSRVRVSLGLLLPDPRRTGKTLQPACRHRADTPFLSGYRTILANGPDGEWYLNDGFGNGDHVSLWPDVYGVDPLNVKETLTPAQQALILGGTCRQT